MVRPRQIGPLPHTAPTEADDARLALPADLLREASRRLGVLALIGAVIWSIADVFAHFAASSLGRSEIRWTDLHAADGIAGAIVLVSLALFVYSRRADRDPRQILDLGLAYMVFVALGLAVMSHFTHLPASRDATAPTVGWLGPVMLMFAAIAPNTPRKMGVAAFVAASMDPLVTGIVTGWHRELALRYPDFVLAGVSVVISRVVWGLGHHVARAREMGSYRLGELLQKGGMGEVYRATHRFLARPAAIKLIRPEMLAQDSRETPQMVIRRFRREAEAAANLRSPHTVELYDFGVTEDRTLYFVMELLDGLTLEDLVRQAGPMPAARAIHVLRQVCDSLEEAHSRGLVHRDIKPANIHLGRRGLRHDWATVLDFGLVKSLPAGASPHGDTSLETAAGLTPGTPAYMAPEIALGREVDGRADLYALGCVAYWLVTGHLVFEAATPLQMIARHLQDEPAPPSTRTELAVPEALDRLILACLRKDPAARPASAAELARALDDVGGERWTEAQAESWWRMNRPG